MIDIDTLLRELGGAGAEIPTSRLAELSHLSHEHANALRERWPEIDLRKRRGLIEQLLVLAEDNVELNFDAVFVIALSDYDADVRRQAIAGLWENEDQATFALLLEMLKEDNAAEVRAEAALALGRFVVEAEMGSLAPADSERVENALQLVIEDDAEEDEVRGRAIEALGARSEGWVTDLIDQAFDSGSRRLRLSAVHAMGRSCDPAWLPILYAQLEDDDPEMRFEATGAIGMIGEDEAVPQLLAMIHDEDIEVQSAAVAALGEIGGATAKGALEDVIASANDALRELALEAISEAEFEEDPLSFSVRGDEVDAADGDS